MPKLRATTLTAEQVWKSPDNTRKIWSLTMDVDGKTASAQTFSEAIATVGWSGEVETYERGNNTFVKQPPKEDGYPPRQGSQASTTGSGSSRNNYVPKDEKAIQAMWAIGQANQAHQQVTPAGDFDGRLESVERLAQELFFMVDRVKATTEDTPEKEATSTEVVLDIFDTAEEAATQVDVEDDPWKPGKT
jgi:hypothetical protein